MNSLPLAEKVSDYLTLSVLDLPLLAIVVSVAFFGLLVAINNRNDRKRH